MLPWLKSTFHFNVAARRLRTRRFAEAAAGFSEVIRLSPDHPAAYVNRGVALQGMNDHRRAVDDFDGAIRLMSSFSPAHRALTYYGRGVSWKFIGDLDRAAADYGQALAINPRFSPAHEELGILASLRQDFDATIAHLSRAIKLSPRRASHYKTRGLAYFDRGSFADAETDLRYAINIADDPYALLFWYLASLKIGRDAAEEFASRARRLNGRQWPFPIVTLYLGKTSDGPVRAAARTADDCAEAEFYIGEWHLHARRRTEAIAALQVAAKSCPRWFMEHTAAVMELKRQRAVGAAENVEESPSSAR
ncbi:MAG TPA: tetratricopeptide repeat protein [Xanthobacteraceae bacterium]|nr:tetratricopeptide repeat protein [Xanthobacteraceae bacterium]